MNFELVGLLIEKRSRNVKRVSGAKAQGESRGDRERKRKMAQKRSYDEMEVSGMEESRAATVHGVFAAPVSLLLVAPAPVVPEASLPAAPVSLPLFSVPVALSEA